MKPRKVDILAFWNKLAGWKKGFIIGSLIFLILSAGISTLYFTKTTHSDMDGIVLIIPGVPLILLTVAATGFQENFVTAFLLDTVWPYLFYSMSFLTWVCLCSLIGMLTEKILKKKDGN